MRVLFAIACVVSVASSLAGQGMPARSAASDCAGLTTLRLADVVISTATVAQPTDAQRALGRGPLCRVAGVIGKETRFVALLPDNWNGRFLMGGTGGFAGTVDNDAQSSVNSGYATAGTDAGHEATTPPGLWALHNDERITDYGHRGVHRTAVVVKQIIQSYYGRAAEKSYFLGCSNGGREALMEAQRYPSDFDGIVALAPVVDFSATASSFIRNLQALYPTGNFTRATITPANLTLLSARVWESCDARDGVRDSILDDPRRCDFRVAALPACDNDVAAADCVTRQQRAAIEAIYSPVRVAGKTVYPGQPIGNEVGWGEWITDISKPVLDATRNGAPSVQGLFGTEFFKYFVFGDSAWNFTRYDIARAASDTRRVDSMVSPKNPDLEPFAARGGKLIIAHGWSDPSLNPLMTIDYYEAVRARTPHHANAVRLFLMPGVLHCGGGTGCDIADWSKTIADWVERGVVPEQVVALKRGPAPSPGAPRATVRTRPLCAYPKTAAYLGAGSTDDEKNFNCK